MQMDLTEQEVKLVQDYRKKADQTCKYLTYDMEGDHCTVGVGQGVGNHCKQQHGVPCFLYKSKAEQYECDCCGKVCDHVEVLCSGLAAISFKYCDDCARKGLEPYNVLVSTFAGEEWNSILPQWQNVIEEVCALNGKALATFHDDCKAFMEMCKHWSDHLE